MLGSESQLATSKNCMPNKHHRVKVEEPADRVVHGEHRCVVVQPYLLFVLKEQIFQGRLDGAESVWMLLGKRIRHIAVQLKIRIVVPFAPIHQKELVWLVEALRHLIDRVEPIRFNAIGAFHRLG